MYEMGFFFHILNKTALVFPSVYINGNKWDWRMKVNGLNCTYTCNYDEQTFAGRRTKALTLLPERHLLSYCLDQIETWCHITAFVWASSLGSGQHAYVVLGIKEIAINGHFYIDCHDLICAVHLMTANNCLILFCVTLVSIGALLAVCRKCSSICSL